MTKLLINYNPLLIQQSTNKLLFNRINHQICLLKPSAFPVDFLFNIPSRLRTIFLISTVMVLYTMKQNTKQNPPICRNFIGQCEFVCKWDGTLLNFLILIDSLFTFTRFSSTLSFTFPQSNPWAHSNLLKCYWTIVSAFILNLETSCWLFLLAK